MKRLLILGGGFLQNFVIIKAKQLGYEVFVLDANPNSTGFKYADAYSVINIVDEEACLSYAIENRVDGVLTAATDYSVLAMSRIASEMGLPGINYDSAKIIKNKAIVRKCLFEAKADDSGISFEVTSLEMVSGILPKIEFPVMVKPCDGSGSRGASRVDNPEDLEKACEFAMAASISHRAVVEPFVVGKEYGVEIFVDQGVIHVLSVIQKEMTLPPYYAELGHAIPSGLSMELELKIKECVCKALKAIGVNHGSINMDLLVNDEQVYIVDVGARMGGNLIGSHIIPIGTGIDYMGNMIKAAVRDPVDFSPLHKSLPVATKLLALTPGVVQELPNFEQISSEYNVVIEHHLHVGDQINEYHTNLDGCGYVIANGMTVQDAINRATLVKKIIDKSIVRK